MPDSQARNQRGTTGQLPSPKFSKTCLVFWYKLQYILLHQQSAASELVAAMQIVKVEVYVREVR